jgi:hypothetical protein
MASKTVITYIRVSTVQQGRSRLGIEAQRQALRQFAKAEGLELAREFVEVETGKGSGMQIRSSPILTGKLWSALREARQETAGGFFLSGDPPIICQSETRCELNRREM